MSRALEEIRRNPFPVHGPSPEHSIERCLVAHFDWEWSFHWIRSPRRLHELIAYVSRAVESSTNFSLLYRRPVELDPSGAVIQFSACCIWFFIRDSFESKRTTAHQKHFKRIDWKSVTFFSQSNELFDKFESSRSTSLQYALPAYYMTVDKVCKWCTTDHQCVLSLKKYVVHLIVEKYRPSTAMTHKFVTHLDSSVEEIKFLKEREKIPLFKGSEDLKRWNEGFPQTSQHPKSTFARNRFVLSPNDIDREGEFIS